jgi:hypothetical protein
MNGIQFAVQKMCNQLGAREFIVSVVLRRRRSGVHYLGWTCLSQVGNWRSIMSTEHFVTRLMVKPKTERKKLTLNGGEIRISA